MNQYDEDPVIRFNQRYIVNEETGCWEWQGAQTGNGYGYMEIGGKRIKTHRFSYQLYNGELIEGLVIMHSCDNRVCVNPEHLSQDTASANIKDMWQKGRAKAGFKKGPNYELGGQCMKGHDLTEKTLMVFSNNARKCRTCWNAKRRENRKNNNSNAQGPTNKGYGGVGQFRCYNGSQGILEGNGTSLEVVEVL